MAERAQIGKYDDPYAKVWQEIAEHLQLIKSTIPRETFYKLMPPPLPDIIRVYIPENTPTRILCTEDGVLVWVGKKKEPKAFSFEEPGVQQYNKAVKNWQESSS